MQALFEAEKYCPYCGEPISLLVDTSQLEQVYTEDCEVCCRPIIVKIRFDTHDDLYVELFSENEG